MASGDLELEIAMKRYFSLGIYIQVPITCLIDMYLFKGRMSTSYFIIIYSPLTGPLVVPFSTQPLTSRYLCFIMSCRCISRRNVRDIPW